MENMNDFIRALTNHMKNKAKEDVQKAIDYSDFDLIEASKYAGKLDAYNEITDFILWYTGEH